MDDGLTYERSLDRQARSSRPDEGTPRARATSNFTSQHSLHSKNSLKELDTDSGSNDNPNAQPPSSIPAVRPLQRVHADSFNSVQSADSSYDGQEYLQSGDGTQNGWSASWKAFSSSRLMMLSLGLLVAMPLLYDTPLLAKDGPSLMGVSAGVIKRSGAQKKTLVDGKHVVPRANTNTNVCNRWSQQSTLVNGTIYLYGGRASTDASQASNEWNNDFLTIDVTKSWDITSPVISGLPQPSGPPPVANGYLWNSYNSLFLYGGEFQDNPVTTPVPYAMWEYSIASSTWTEHQNPKTSSGNNSDGGNQPVLGSAEGAGVSVPELGRGWYFGGHQDWATTPGWSNQINRLYLKSLLEFTFPGHTNDGVQSLTGGKTAGNDGAWRNITQGGIQDTATFPSRADSVLVYIPGYGADGILINMGGGTNESFVSLGFCALICRWLTLTPYLDADEYY